MIARGYQRHTLISRVDAQVAQRKYPITAINPIDRMLKPYIRRPPPAMGGSRSVSRTHRLHRPNPYR